MRAEYKRDVNHNYLILQEEGVTDTSSYQVRMLAGNVIPSILKCHLQNLDGQVLFSYDVTSKQSVSMLFEEKKLKGKDLRLIFGGFVRVMEELTEYLMNPEYLVLQPEYIFLDVESERVYFCCLPGLHREVQDQFRELVEYILPKMDHEDQDAVMLGYGIYRKALEPGFQLETVKAAVYQNREEAAGEEDGEAEDEIDFSGGYKEERIEKAGFWDRGEERSEKKGEKRTTHGKRQAAEIMETDSAWDADDRREVRQAGDSGQGKAFEWKWIAGCGVGVLVMLGILAASLLGYLPWLPAELVMACGILALGAGAFAAWIADRKKKRQEYVSDWRNLESGAQVKAVETCAGTGSAAGKKKMTGGAKSGKVTKRETTAKAEGKSMSNRRLSERLYDENWEDFPAVHDKRVSESFMASEDQPHPEPLQEQELYGETVVLCAGQNRGPASLVSREPGELATIYLEQETTVVGKLATASDAVIPVPTVSRVHARIRKKDGEYYLVDLNSRNGTAVNGQMLKGNEEYQLQDEDQVDFAQARYVFVK